MIKSFKTTTEVLVVPRLGISSEVQVDVTRVIFNGLAYEGIATYSYFVDGAKVTMEETSATFTAEEANQLAAMAPLAGATFTEDFITLIARATLYQLNAAGYFGLTGQDWVEM